MMRISMFRLSPLLLLAAALLALAVLFAPGAQPAEAQQRVWSARLTVQEVSAHLQYGCHDGTTGKECSAALTDNTFTFGGVDYVIEELSVLTGGSLNLKLDKTIPDSLDTLVLYVGGDARLVWADGAKSTTTNTNDSISWEGTGVTWAAGDVVGLTMQTERAPSPLRRVSLSVSPNPVAEGSSVTVTATLLTPAGTEQGTLASDVTIPLTVTARSTNTLDNDGNTVTIPIDSAEDGDYGSLASITITAGSTTGTGAITTAQDTDADDETFTVALGDLSAVENVTSGPVTSVQVRITDDESASPGTLSVDTGFGNPVCGSTVSVTSETPKWAVFLSPAPAVEENVDYRILADSNGGWLPAAPIHTTGNSVYTSFKSYAELMETSPGFRGIQFRLSDHPEVTASCTYTFQTGGV